MKVALTHGKRVTAAILVLVLGGFAIVGGYILFLYRGETVYESEQAFSGQALRFEFPIESSQEHGILLTQKIQHGVDYTSRLALRLELPSGRLLEQTILQYHERERDEALSGFRSVTSPAFEFTDQPGTAVLTVDLVDQSGEVTLTGAKITVKLRE